MPKTTLHRDTVAHDSLIHPESAGMIDSVIHTDTIVSIDTVATDISTSFSVSITSQPDSILLDSIPTADTIVPAWMEIPPYWNSLITGEGFLDYLTCKNDTLCASSVQKENFNGYKGMQLSDKPKEMDLVFLVFFVCSFFSMAAFSKGKYLLSSLVNNIFHIKSRPSIFYETTGNDFRNKLFLLAQTILLSAVLVYTIMFHYYADTSAYTLYQGMLTIGYFALLLVLYLLYKWFTYRIVCNVFFDKPRYLRWMEDWVAQLNFTGIVIFFPVLFLYYVPILYYFSIVVLSLYIFIISIVFIYKTFAIFFGNLKYLHYIILYLCAQEIIPLYLLYEGLIYVFKKVETGALWI